MIEIKLRHEGEIIPNGLSITETRMSTYVVIQHLPERIVVRISKEPINEPDYSISIQYPKEDF